MGLRTLKLWVAAITTESTGGLWALGLRPGTTRGTLAGLGLAISTFCGRLLGWPGVKAFGTWVGGLVHFPADQAGKSVNNWYILHASVRNVFLGGWGGGVKVKATQSCQTLCDPMDYTVHGILQDRILEWVAFPFIRDLPNPGIKPKSHTVQADSLPAEPQGKPIFLRGGKGSSGKFETSWQEK